MTLITCNNQKRKTHRDKSRLAWPRGSGGRWEMSAQWDKDFYWGGGNGLLLGRHGTANVRIDTEVLTSKWYKNFTSIFKKR